MTGSTTAPPGGRTGRRVPPRRPAPRRRRRLTRRGVIALGLAVALLCAAGLYVVYGSPWLRVRRLTVTGTRVLTAEQVRAASGISPGEPMAAVDASAVAARLRSALPRLATVSVGWSWPDAVTVRVTERTARVVLKAGRAFVEVDAGGDRFATDATAPPGVPRVEFTGAAGSPPRGTVFTTAVLLHAAVQVSADLPESVRRQTELIQVASFDGITLELTGGRSVLWGSPESGARKAAALTALLKAQPGAAHYDVSAPTAPAASGG